MTIAHPQEAKLNGLCSSSGRFHRYLNPNRTQRPGLVKLRSFEDKFASMNYAAQIRLLAVDDDDCCGDLIVRTALRCGYEAFAISDEQRLEQAIDHWRPHVVTLDLCLPNVDGLEIVWRLNRTRFPGHLIIVSGQPERVRAQAAEIACANGLKVPAHMSKPVHLAQLRNLLTIIRAGGLAPSTANSASAGDDQMTQECREYLADAHEGYHRLSVASSGQPPARQKQKI